MIAIVDYRAGNLTSVAAAVNTLGFPCSITSDPDLIRRADRIIFPGVGAAGTAMQNLAELGLQSPIREAVEKGKPFLGICLGYQVLFGHSAEDGGVDCLGLLKGNVIRFPDRMREPGDTVPLKIPQMGWNEATFAKKHPVLVDVPEHSEFYFVHSYYPEPAREDVCATTHYGIDFASGAATGSLVAFQFHPEKSGRPGLKILDNFCRWTP